MDETRIKVNCKLEPWRNALEFKGLRLSRIEDMEHMFNKIRNRDECDVKLKDRRVP